MLVRQIKLLLMEQPAICPNLFSSNDFLISIVCGANLDATHDRDTSLKWSDVLSGLDHMLGEKKHLY